MKILSVIVGLALTAGGVYLAYDTFMLFDDLETLRLGLLLGASFLAMTVGLYLFLLPLAMKPKAKKNKRMVQETVVELETHDEVISETEALNLIQANSDDRETSIEETIDTPLEMVEEAMQRLRSKTFSTKKMKPKPLMLLKKKFTFNRSMSISNRPSSCRPLKKILNMKWMATLSSCQVSMKL